MKNTDSQRLGAGRQYGPKIEDIKPNHRFRYIWARDKLQGQDVVDAGCGIGYGSWILADGGSNVIGLEFNPSVVKEAKRLWPAPNINFREWDLCGSNDYFPPTRDVVAFEVLEHLVMPERFLCALVPGTLLFGSVPHSAYLQHTILVNPFHIKHYTYDDLGDLLGRCGYDDPQWHYQYKSEVVAGRKEDARTLSFMAVRTRQTQAPSSEEYASSVLRELLRRSNVINDLKNGRRQPRAQTAF